MFRVFYLKLIPERSCLGFLDEPIVLLSICFPSRNLSSLRLFLLFWHIKMSVARFAVEPPAITKPSSPRGYPMRLFELECDSTQFADVSICVHSRKLACETTPYGSHKSFWCKRLGLGSSSKQKAFAFMIFRRVAFCAKRD